MENSKNQLKDVEVDSSSVPQLTSFETSSDNNVRNRVTSWLTEIVGEVRKKGATVSITKWVDSSNSENLSQNNSLVDEQSRNKICDNFIDQTIANNLSDENSYENSNDNNLVKESQNSQEFIAESNILPSKFWSKFTFDRNQPLQSNIVTTHTNEPSKVYQIKAFGRTKFYEIFEKVKLSKERLPNLRKFPSTMDQNIIKKENSFDDDDGVEKTEEVTKDIEKGNENETLNKNNKNVEQHENFIGRPENSQKMVPKLNEEPLSETSFEENANLNDINVENVSKNEEIQFILDDQHKIQPNHNQNRLISFKKFQRNLKLADLGKSSTLNPQYLCDDDNSKYYLPKNPSFVTSIDEEKIEAVSAVTSTPNYKSQRYLAFGGMCRSFSEQQPDVIDETDELLNERSHSCYHVIEEEDSEKKISKPRSEENTNNIMAGNKPIDINHISTSLPTFSTLQHIKSPGKQDSISGGGDSSSSICMDISPCGSGSGTSTSDARDLHLQRRNTFIRDNSYQSDSSHCSSVDSLLESRKPDPETILISLGFGPIDSENVLAKIPKRFLKPSQVRGINTEAFLKREQLMNSIHDHSVLGYRGLIGNPDLPPSVIVGKIMERFEQNERNRWNFYEYNRPQSAPPNSMEIQKFQYNT